MLSVLWRLEMISRLGDACGGRLPEPHHVRIVWVKYSAGVGLEDHELV